MGGRAESLQSAIYRALAENGRDEVGKDNGQRTSIPYGDHDSLHLRGPLYTLADKSLGRLDVDDR